MTFQGEKREAGAATCDVAADAGGVAASAAFVSAGEGHGSDDGDSQVSALIIEAKPATLTYRKP